MNRRNWKHLLRAQVRDTRVLLRESRWSLFLFFLIIISGTIIFHFVYTYPGTAQHPGLAEAAFSTFTLVFLQPVLPFPDQWYLQVLFFVIPVVGLAAVADGVLHFGVALVNKQERGQKWQVAMASTFSNHIIVCGLGKIGYRVVLELVKYGRDVVAVEMDSNSRFVEKAQDLGVPIIFGDARRREVLEKTNVRQASAIIPCTENEWSNLDIAMDAREINPEIKVVIRLFDQDLARRVEKAFGFDAIYSASALTAPVFASAAVGTNIKAAFFASEQLLTVSEVFVEPDVKFMGWTIGQLEATYDLAVIYYQGGQVSTLHPASDLVLQPGSRITVAAPLDTLTKLKK